MMKASPLRFISCLGIILFASLFSYGIDTKDTGLLTQPAIGPTQIAFVYANDLWTADLDGRNARRLTTDIGLEMSPVFSPDGGFIAFSGQYDGNTDVYVVPASGGVPKRLTWHPGADIVQGFTPDGSAVLFTSGRFSFTGRYTQLFTVPVGGGFPERLKIPHAFRAVYSPDGTRLAYNPPLRRVHPMEALPGRDRLRHLDLRHEGQFRREDPPARRPGQRSRADVDRGQGLLPVGPERRVQHLLLRHEIQGD